MELLIKIPKEFEQHFKEDAFEDSLHRLSADAHLLAGNYEQETAKMLIEAFKSAVPVPPHGKLIDADAFVKEKRERYCKQNCERRKGIKNGEKCFIYKIGEIPCIACEIDDLISAVDDAPTIIEAEKL